jgi:hypothetical protein
MLNQLNRDDKRINMSSGNQQKIGFLAGIPAKIVNTIKVLTIAIVCTMEGIYMFKKVIERIIELWYKFWDLIFGNKYQNLSRRDKNKFIVLWIFLLMFSWGYFESITGGGDKAHIRMIDEQIMDMIARIQGAPKWKR